MRVTSIRSQRESRDGHPWTQNADIARPRASAVRHGKWGRAKSSCFELVYTRGRQRKCRAGVVGFKTTTDRLSFLVLAVEVLHEKGLRLLSVRNVDKKHVAVLVEWILTSKYANASRATYLNHLRWWMHAVGKSHLEKFVLKEGNKNRPKVCRSYVAREDKSLRPTGVSDEEMLGRVYAIDARVAAVLLLMNTFGLRMMEAWQFCPWESHDKRGRITIRYGTKGGRARTHRSQLVAKHVEQAVIDICRAFAPSRSDSMIPRGTTKDEARAHFYYVMRKVGFTRKDLKRTPHALRHGVALDIFAQCYGGDAPARGGVCDDQKHYREAQAVTADFMGHRRPDNGSAYNGSRRQVARRTSRRPKDLPQTQAWIDVQPAEGVIARHSEPLA